MVQNIKKLASTLLGIVFGFLLVSVGATTFNLQAEMFLLQDFQLPIVLAVAMATGVIGVWIIRRTKAISLISQDEIEYRNTVFNRRLLLGCAMFGIGWALTASCPGTAVAMLGEGKVVGVPVVLGILCGTWLFGWYSSRVDQDMG